MSFRVLITGSRAWTDKHAIANAIAQNLPRYLIVQDPVIGERMQWDQVTVVHGHCPRGADRIADRIATAWGMNVERHPADWATHGRKAGPIRNAVMVSLGADVCLAFPIGESRGTRSCMRMAANAGIPVHTYEGTPTP